MGFANGMIVLLSVHGTYRGTVSRTKFGIIAGLCSLESIPPAHLARDWLRLHSLQSADCSVDKRQLDGFDTTELK